MIKDISLESFGSTKSEFYFIESTLENNKQLIFQVEEYLPKTGTNVSNEGILRDIWKVIKAIKDLIADILKGIWKAIQWLVRGLNRLVNGKSADKENLSKTKLTKNVKFKTTIHSFNKNKVTVTDIDEYGTNAENYETALNTINECLDEVLDNPSIRKSYFYKNDISELNDLIKEIDKANLDNVYIKRESSVVSCTVSCSDNEDIVNTLDACQLVFNVHKESAEKTEKTLTRLNKLRQLFDKLSPSNSEMLSSEEETLVKTAISKVMYLINTVNSITTNETNNIARISKSYKEVRDKLLAELANQ